MKKTFLSLAILAAGTASATPFTGNDTKSSAMGNTGVASADSFAASQFNPALLAAYGSDVSFGLQLPSLKVAIEDGNGFVKHTNDYFIDGDVIDNFENVSFQNLDEAVNGTGSGDALSDLIASASTNADELNTAIQAEDYPQAEIEADELTADTTELDNRVETVRSELTNFQTAFDGANEGVSGFQGKPLQLLGSIGSAIAIPRSGLGLALHFNNDSSIGMQAHISESDLTQISNGVSDVYGYTGEADDVTTLSNTLAQETNELVALFDDPRQSGTAAEQQAWADDVQAASDDVTIAQAELDAENSGSDQTVTLSDGSTTYTANSDGENLNNYSSDNGYFVNGQFQETETDGFGDDSTITILGANVAEVGISVAREFTYLGQTFSAGVTPKLQSITIFEDTIQLNNAEEEVGDDPLAYLSRNTTSVFTGNLDIGLAKNWYNVLGGQIRSGLVVKDIIPQTFESQSGRELSMSPKMRIGAAHQTRWSTLAVDLDITENEPLAYGVPTRYLGLGAELNAFNWMKVRAGYRNNLSVEDSHVVTTGLGFTPFGAGLDFSGWFKPKPLDAWDEIVQDAGISAQFSMQF